MSNVSDFLFQGATPSSFTNTATATQTMPAWWQDATKALITQGSAIAAQPFPLYQGPRIAGFSPLQQQSFSDASKLMPQSMQAINQGEGFVSNAAQPFNRSEYNNYLDPYVTGANSEISSLQNLATQNLTENVLPAINNGFIGQGMFGQASAGGVPSRDETITQRALKNANTSLLSSEGSVLNNAYNNAMGAYQQGRGQQLQAGQAMGALGAVGNNIGVTDIGLENQLGGQQQGQQQGNLDLAYNDFLQQAAYPQNQLNNLSALVHGYQPPSATSVYGTNPQAKGNVTLGQQGFGANAGLGTLGSLGILNSLG